MEITGPIITLVYRVQAARRPALLDFLRQAFPFYEKPGGIRMALFESLDDAELLLELVAYATSADYERDQLRVENDAEMRTMLDAFKAAVGGPVEVRRLQKVDSDQPMKLKREPTRLEKKAKKGFKGYPVATIAYYGPDNAKATKVAVGIVAQENGEAVAMEKWHATSDIRIDATTNKAILAFIAEHGAKSVVMADRIIGCPHEEGTDYPTDQSCPQCPYWEGRDRWTGHHVH